MSWIDDPWMGFDTETTGVRALKDRLVTDVAAKDLARFEVLGYGEFPVVIAKTHLSISSDPTLRGDPRGWRMPVREVRVAAGAGYVYAISGEMRTMPGLPKHPAAASIDLDADGNVVGLF